MEAKNIKKLPAAETLLFGIRLDRKQIKKPLVAIVYSQNGICPGHMGLDDLAGYVQTGIAEAGGVGIKMNAGVGICDGIAQGHEGMRYPLPSRELNRDCVVSMIKAHGVFEGVVYLAACDKNIPGYLMAAAHLDLPGIFVTAGPMLPGYINGKRIDVVDASEANAQYEQGDINQKEYEKIIEECCPTIGTCAGLMTANSMACITEVLGLTIPKMATIPAVESKKYRLATESGRRIMELIDKEITTRQILNKKAFKNALRVDMSIGASTNTILHLQAIAKEVDCELSLDEIQSISDSTPNILKLSPMTRYWVSDFDKAGGIPVVMNRLKTLLEIDIETVAGSWRHRLENIEDNGDTRLIKNLQSPHSSTGGIVVLKGNLAPEGALIKVSGINPSVPKIFNGKAQVFNSEEEATIFVKQHELNPGSVLVIRYEGPAGGPGMREMFYLGAWITGLNKDKEIALITDGRFSGGTRGICVGHISPEAYNGGPIALIKNGDDIEINLNDRTINLLISNNEMADRKENWQRIEKETSLDNVLKEFRKKSI